ncbi:MAG: hypothetical protein EAX96_04195 [Candidatus Lokiarchaeota archaeon]|nr:hypothetical protein [Candidatus Lokiarchaeota archaeon]
MDKKNKKLLKIGNLVSWGIMFTLNLLATFGIIGVANTGTIADLYPNLFVPSGFVFPIIWNVIFFSQLAFALYSSRDLFIESAKNIDMPYLEQVNIFFIIANAMNATWIIVWGYLLPVISIIFMIGLLLCLVIIYLRLGIGINSNERTLKDKIFVDFTFSWYFAWISIATIANVTAILVYLGFSDGGNYMGTLLPGAVAGTPFLGINDVAWYCIMVLVGAVLALIMLRERKDFVFAGLITFALIGIFLKRILDIIALALFAGMCADFVIIGIIILGIYLLYQKKN